MIKNRGFTIVIFLILTAVAVIAGVLIFYPSRKSENAGPNNFLSQVRHEPQPSPFPFMEMTIPYLRERGYESKIFDMNQVSQNSSYTSYLASYDSDGNSVNGLLTVPRWNEPEGGYPAIVFVHGYIPPNEYQTLSDYASYVDFLAKQGFAVFKIDLRGHANSEGMAGGAYYSEDYIVDVLNAKAALASSDFVNGENIGFWGHSMAGNVVFRSMAVSAKTKAVVIWAGAVYTYEDFGEFGISDNSYQPPQMDTERQRKRDSLFNTYGRFSSESDFWKQVPATNYLDGIAGAVQVHHATGDNVVDIRYSRNLMSVLDSTDLEHELFEYNSGGHNISGSSFNVAMQRSADFFREKLK